MGLFTRYLQEMKPEVEKRVREIKKEIARHIEFYVDEDTTDISVVCDIRLTIIKPCESIIVDLKVP